ncbi:hypothetical protein CBW46_014195 [Paenibacillus xerothermodurans]|uniref:Uncharacterized protein n=2 Tax=Paenibacillus xerothermodurans TaxID=1977292 RepID=A0A2W1NLJ0_PAEXE|nr:hypothetical protein CBW46_014195 [Paenibacillus xerothermodurans]
MQGSDKTGVTAPAAENIAAAPASRIPQYECMRRGSIRMLGCGWRHDARVCQRDASGALLRNRQVAGGGMMLGMTAGTRRGTLRWRRRWDETLIVSEF